MRFMIWSDFIMRFALLSVSIFFGLSGALHGVMASFVHSRFGTLSYTPIASNGVRVFSSHDLMHKLYWPNNRRYVSFCSFKLPSHVH
jgi:hypothetical protein